jgi:riboflavin synthase
MFTGIIETTGKVIGLKPDKGNLEILIHSSITPELKIDQSVSHNGVCLTVVEVNEKGYRVTAIGQTLKKSNLGLLKMNDEINLERCMKIGDRLDGHIVQGHVDQTAECTSVKEENGSWVYQFKYAPSRQSLIVEKGSVCVNGISLTAFDVMDNFFKVAIIPYTYRATNIKYVQHGAIVNLEFDILGKYIAAMMRFNA